MADDPAPPYHLIETSAQRRVRERDEQKRRDEKAKALQLWFNGILTLATIVTVGTVVYQNRILERTLKEIATQSDAAVATVDLSEKSVDVSRTAMDASIKQGSAALNATLGIAKDQLAVADRIMRFQERPWVTIDRIYFEEVLAVDKAPVIRLELTNTGRTPAVNTVTWSRAFYGVSVPPDAELFKDEWPRERLIPITVGPGGSALIYPPALSPPLTEDSYAAINEDRMSIFLIGTIRYADFFKEEKRTTFCFRTRGFLLGSRRFIACGSGQQAK